MAGVRSAQWYLRKRTKRNLRQRIPAFCTLRVKETHEMQGQAIEILATSVMLAMLAVAVVTDLRTGKVYNWLTAPAVVVGLTLGAVGGGLPAITDRLLGIVVVLAATILLSRVAGLGGGDVKLLAAVGALQGFHFAIWAMLLTGVCGGVLATMVMLRRRAVKATAMNMYVAMLTTRGGLRTDLAAGSVGGRIPYSIAIALGAALALALRT
jgi:prepilin peptidase CpaA